jgi:hypothetical protein
MFGVSGNVLSISERIRNDGKVSLLLPSACSRTIVDTIYQAPRYNIDKWDEMMMERDRRLTGSFRGQTVSRVTVKNCLALASCLAVRCLPCTDAEQTNPVAPESFGTNSVWETEKII